MITIYNVGEKVFVLAEVEQINITEANGVRYSLLLQGSGEYIPPIIVSEQDLYPALAEYNIKEGVVK